MKNQDRKETNQPTPDGVTAGDTHRQATEEPAPANAVLATLEACWGSFHSRAVASAAAKLAEIAAAKLFNRACEVLDPDDGFYDNCGAEELVLEIFGCVSDELMGEDVKEWALETLEPWCEKRDSQV